MSKHQYFVAGAISIFALLLILLRFRCPAYPVDSTTLGLAALAILPWLTLFFKKFKVAGIEGEAHDRAQGFAGPTAPKAGIATGEGVTATDSVLRFRGLPANAQKILRTLWRYQKQSFKDDFSRRWTFAILPNVRIYSEYLEGVSVLFKMGLVVMNPENHQVALTNEGIILMESLGDNDIRGDFYLF